MLRCRLSFIHLLFITVKMKEDELKKYMLKIGELVLDEDKIVTYKFLSRTLDIHVNTAKQLLHTFYLQQQKLKPGNVSATYLLAGLLKDGSYVVSIINGDNLNEAYLKFDVITSEHVYSIQNAKASNIERISEALYIADSNLKHNKSLVIKCDEAVEGDDFESSSNTHAQNVEQTVSSNVSVKTEEKFERKEKVTDITKFFENSQSKENGVVKKSPQRDKKRNSIAHFFNNHSQRKKLNVEECVEEKAKTPKSLDNKGEGSRNIDGIDLEQMSISEKANEEKKVNGKGVNKSKNVEKRKSKTGDSKKRKRIISDSEESESDEEKLDAMLCTETEVSQNVGRPNRFEDDDDDDDDDDIFRHKKKKKKFVDKTILCDDGYMETIKEAVYETDSESESQPKKEIKKVENEALPKSSKPQETIKRKAPASKITGNSKPKQQTLLSFFKKS